MEPNLAILNGKTNKGDFILNIGAKCTGKTTLCKQFIKRAEPLSKILIIDANNEYLDYPKIKKKDLAEFMSNDCGVFRFVFDKRMTIKSFGDTYRYIMQNYRNGLLICEEPFWHIQPDDDEFLGMISTSRTRGVYLILNVQTLSKVVEPKILQNCRYMILHKTCDVPERYREKLGYNYKLISEGFELLDKDNRFSAVLIDFNKETVIKIER